MRSIDKVLADRERIVKHLKHGICPCCGFDIEWRYNHIIKAIRTFCTRKGCKFHKESYQNIYKWLIHHNF